MDEANGTVIGALDPAGEWRDPPGMGRILLVSSSVGVGLSLVLITVGMLATGQVWQSSLALGVFVAFWGGLGFGSMIGGVVYLTKVEDAAKLLEAEQAAASPSIRSVDDGETATGVLAEGNTHVAHAAHAA